METNLIMISVLSSDFSHLNLFLKKYLPSKIFILCDENTHQYCLPEFLANLETEIPFEIIEIEAGEEMKTLETAGYLWEILSDFDADRKAVLINLGGGVITDLGGFVASLYKRGIHFVNIPTTLLAMCDASLGGKTGIDHHYLKNLVGTFSLPQEIFIYPPFLDTLPYEELRSGFAEMLKHGLIANQKHWEELTSLENLTSQNISPFIETSMKIKQEVVEKDFKEENLRKILNFGHTFGHAIESYFLEMGRPILHGEAVAAGMICEIRLAFLECLISEEIAEELISKIAQYFPVLDLTSLTQDKLFSLMNNDKKNFSSTIRFSLINGIGSCEYDKIAGKENIIAAFYFYKNRVSL